MPPVGTTDNMMTAPSISNMGPSHVTVERFCIFRETKESKQINYHHTVSHDKIFHITIQYAPTL
jgi:hypothetical protein